MYYPVNLDLRGKACLVVGGGKVALRKVKGLLKAGASLTLLAPRFEGAIQGIGRGRIRLIRDRFRATYLRGFSLVIVATDDSALNSKIASLCRKRQLLVNVVDRPADCTFTVPSVFRRGPLTIAISTNGASPALSKKIRKELKKRYGRVLGAFLNLMAEIRKEAVQRIPDPRKRKKRFEKVIDSDMLALLRGGKKAEARQRIREIFFEENRRSVP